MKFLRILLLLVSITAFAFGCVTFKASGLAYVHPGQNFITVGEFSTEVWVDEFLGSSGGSKLGNITSDATEGPVKDAIETAIKAKGGTGAINITIVHQATILNILLNVLTGSLYAPSMVLISGTVIK